MRSRHNRLGRLRQVIDASPVRRHLLREAYEWFVEFGELPEDDDHLAYEVVQRALRGGEEEPPADEDQAADRLRRARRAYHQRERPGMTWPPSVRAMLFDEALFEPESIRRVARAVIAAEVARGGDVESRAFAARHGIPSYGSVAMHVLGWPRVLAIEPYEEQAQRLFVRLDNIKGRIPHDDERWFEAQGKAVVAFRQTGELPADDLHCESVLANAELDLLVAHKQGKDVAAAMALFDQLAWSEGGDLAQALRGICELAKAGGLA